MSDPSPRTPQDLPKHRARVMARWLLYKLPLLILLGLLPLLVFSVGYGIWYFNRPQPPSLDHQQLFPGVWYTREVRQFPVPQVIHIVEIDLTTPGLHFRVPPADNKDGYTYAARTVSQFLTEQGLDLAINGDYFDPWRDKHILDYYPHVGDGVNIHGLTASEGTIVSEGYAKSYQAYNTLYLSADNHASFDRPNTLYNAISGSLEIVTEGRVTPRLYTMPVYLERHPRTAIALSKDERRMIIVVVDGRQPHYSEGANMIELAQILLAFGGYTGLNMDGGGSSTLVMRGADGQAVVLNSPIQNRIPGRERPIANQLGLWYDRP